PQVEAARAGGGIEVARWIVVRALLLGVRKALAIDGGRPECHRPLERTLSGAAPATRQPQWRRRDRAIGAAGIARGPVERTVVALLIAFEDAVAARFDPTVGRAAVTRDPVAVVALLTDLGRPAVSAHGGIRQAHELELAVAVMQRGIQRAGVEPPPAETAHGMRHHEGHRCRAECRMALESTGSDCHAFGQDGGIERLQRLDRTPGV